MRRPNLWQTFRSSSGLESNPMSNFELMSCRSKLLGVEKIFERGKLLLPCVGPHQGYPGFCSPWAGGVMPACGLSLLAGLHPPLVGCHLCSPGLTATTAGLRMPPWARARHQSHRHQQGVEQGLDNEIGLLVTSSLDGEAGLGWRSRGWGGG